MTAPALRIEAPSDAQLRYIRGLCEEHGVERATDNAADEWQVYADAS